MNKEQAKEWLSAYLEGLEFEDNPELKEALSMAETDPELKDWWQRQRELDQQMEEALHEIPVPEDLESRLLETVRGKQVRTTSRWTFTRRFAWGAGIAAVLVMGFALVLQTRQHEVILQNIQARISGTSPDSFNHFRDGMAYFIRSVYFQLDHFSNDIDSIESWLEAEDAPRFNALPEELLALNPIGCKKFKWKEQDVTLVCFHTVEGKIVHMFILDRDQARPDQYMGIDSIARSHELETGGWVTDTNVYVLVGSDPEVDVEFALG
jgi:hypothetical protein